MTWGKRFPARYPEIMDPPRTPRPSATQCRRFPGNSYAIAIRRPGQAAVTSRGGRGPPAAKGDGGVTDARPDERRRPGIPRRLHGEHLRCGAGPGPNAGGGGPRGRGEDGGGGRGAAAARAAEQESRRPETGRRRGGPGRRGRIGGSAAPAPESRAEPWRMACPSTICFLFIFSYLSRCSQPSYTYLPPFLLPFPLLPHPFFSYPFLVVCLAFKVYPLQQPSLFLSIKYYLARQQRPHALAETGKRSVAGMAPVGRRRRAGVPTRLERPCRGGQTPRPPARRRERWAGGRPSWSETNKREGQACRRARFARSGRGRGLNGLGCSDCPTPGRRAHDQPPFRPVEPRRGHHAARRGARRSSRPAPLPGRHAGPGGDRWPVRLGRPAYQPAGSK